MIDLSKLPPDTIITKEMLEPQQGERFLVIEHDGKCNKIIRKSTEVEFEAYKAYISIVHRDKILIRANVTYSNLSKQFCDKEFILDYEPIEVLEKGMN